MWQPSPRCHPERQYTRTNCSEFVACQPADACLGNNVCADGYEGIRCASCAEGTHYRINGLCEECPDNPWLLFLALIAAACVAGGGAYVLNSKNVNLAFMSVRSYMIMHQCPLASSIRCCPFASTCFIDLLPHMSSRRSESTTSRCLLSSPVHELHGPSSSVRCSRSCRRST